MKRLFLLFALLYVMVQGAWAQVEIPDPTHFDDTWDGTTKTQPVYDASSGYVIIEKASELAYINDHFTDDAGGGKYYYNQKYLLKANIDMGDAVSWIPLDRGHLRGFQGEFHGENHTIRIHIWGTDDNYQGFISDNSGIVQDLHLTGKIEVGNSRTVGAIAAGNTGHIKNCWVSADVSSTHYNGLNNARLGGIVGLNTTTQDDAEVGKIEYCCMTGNVSNSGNNSGVGGILGVQEQCNGIISHIMFYGTRINDHSQDNLWVGSLSTRATFENYHSTDDLGNDDALNNYLSSFSGNDLYRYALKHPYAVNVTTVGQGSVTVSAGDEDNILGARPHQEVTLTTPSGMNAEVTATDADGNNVTLFGNSGASGYTFIMQNSPVNVHVVFTVPDWPRQGRGTADDPYLITSAADWNEFALSVSAGTTHSGQYVKLTKDISIWMMAGASKDCSFQGTLDGDGHTLTLNYNATNAVAAPFRYTKNATIKNLRTTGTITTAAMNAAGIVGDVTGSVNLTNCSSSVTISSSRADADYHGGLVASNNGSVTISGCVFDGSFVATVAHVNLYGTTFCGGLVGYCGENTSTTITNSLVAPTSVSEGMVSNTFVVTNDGAVLSIGNSYFVATTNLPTNQGQQAHTISAGDDVTISDIGEATTTYGSDGITVYENGIKYRDTFFVVSGKTVSLTLSHGDKMGYLFSQYAASAGTISAQTETSATLTMPAANITISAEWTKFIDGTGTADDPYVIDNADDWNTFANFVNGGYAFSGNFVKLGDDISVSTMAGTSSNQFQGTFDGDGQTLTFTKGTSAEPFAEEYCAPFRHVKNATIKNLHVDGTIYTSAKKAAGFVGESHQNLSITGCRSSISIVSSTVTGDDNHDGTHGGFVGTLSGSGNTITIDGCVFDGSFATTNGTTNCGGFIGWPTYNRPTITNSLMIPASVGAGMVANTFSRSHTGYEPTITNCYFVAAANLPTDQGTEAIVLDIAPANLGSLVEDYGMMKAYQNGILVGGLYYVDRTMASFRLLSDATTGDVGKVVCAAGHLHPAKTVVPDGCTAVGILGKVTETGRGLIIALQNAPEQTWLDINGWTSVTAYAGTTLKQLPDDATRGSLTSYTTLGKTTVSNWCVAQKSDYEAIFINLGSTTGDSAGKTYDTNVNAYITTVVGGTALSGEYWSASVTNSNLCWGFKSLYWFEGNKSYSRGIRPVLGFTFIASELPGTGTAGDPYTISNSDEWNNFAYNVNSGNTFSGKYVKLTSDISVTTPVGYRVSDSDNKPFSGTFLGGGNTITVTLDDDGNQGLAPFRYINGATIKDLKVAGTIASSQYHTSGLVGFAKGTNTIEDCLVTTTLNITSNYAGGIIGHGLSSNTTIRGCVFAGTINGVDVERENIGGIWGWSSSGTPTLLDCLEKGTYTNIASMHPMGLQGGSGTITNCYYVNPQVGSPINACTVSGAKQAYTAATAPANLGSLVEDYGMVKAYKNGIWFDGNFYVKNTFVLTEDAGVTELIDYAGATDQLVSFTRSGLTANAYSTMCLPFSFKAPSACTFYAFKGIGWNSSNQQWEATITQQDANATLSAHTPYIFKCAETEATFTGTIATVAASYGDDELSNGAVDATDGDDKAWTFKGTYAAISWANGNPDVPTYGFSTYVPVEQGNTQNIAAGTFVRFVQGASLAPFRARLIYSGENTHLKGPVRGSGNDNDILPQYIVVRIINNNGTITTVGAIDTETGEITNDAWFTLEGKMLTGEPTESGIYIYKGQKVSISK